MLYAIGIEKFSQIVTLPPPGGRGSIFDLSKKSSLSRHFRTCSIGVSFHATTTTVNSMMKANCLIKASFDHPKVAVEAPLESF